MNELFVYNTRPEGFVFKAVTTILSIFSAAGLPLVMETVNGCAEVGIVPI